MEGLKRRKAEDRHPVPDGCQWSPDCEKCPWGDCVSALHKSVAYSSEDGLRLRERLIILLQSGAVTYKATAARFHTDIEAVERFVETNLNGLTEQDQETIQMYKQGDCSMRDLARRFGVAESTISRRIEKIGGLSGLMKRTRDNTICRSRHEGESPVSIANRFGLSVRTVQRVVEARAYVL